VFAQAHLTADTFISGPMSFPCMPNRTGAPSTACRNRRLASPVRLRRLLGLAHPPHRWLRAPACLSGAAGG
jgi:hypothetical protein